MDGEILTAEEKQALDMLQSSLRKVDGHYECKLLWRRPDIVLPNSLPTAERRFAILEDRFRRNPILGRDCEATVNEYISMGHAKEAEPCTSRTRHWFLPHHGVCSQSKPGKVRVAFDASARTNGISLNDVLLSVPKLLTDLLSVLLRFRERPVAVSADI
ncbi:hypothetical protein M513_09300 [Trichuris suis]|uniref:Uncharacterized protein n=1 Tax=Trichuris suis TaxID=68888 RepID=A0A085LXY7_9BILA|nr:hypothetical protein M513_09300 [Trichuris suis]